MARGKRIMALLDAWAGKGRVRVRDNKRRIKVLPQISQAFLHIKAMLMKIPIKVK